MGVPYLSARPESAHSSRAQAEKMAAAAGVQQPRLHRPNLCTIVAPNAAGDREEQAGRLAGLLEGFRGTDGM